MKKLLLFSSLLLGHTAHCMTLVEAAKKGEVAIVQEFIADGADIDQTDENGWTPICCAACNGHEKVVQILVQNNVDLDKATKCGWTPIYCAALNGHEKILSS